MRFFAVNEETELNKNVMYVLNFGGFASVTFVGVTIQYLGVMPGIIHAVASIAIYFPWRSSVNRAANFR